MHCHANIGGQGSYLAHTMKNNNQESKRSRVRQYHRNIPWRLNTEGLYVPHAYPNRRELSWWDDVGFIVNGRRVMVWWVHPRLKYANAVDDAGWAEVGEPPTSLRSPLDPDSCTKQYKHQGRSRKKVVGYKFASQTGEATDFFNRLNTVQRRIETEGIDLVVRPSMSVKTLDWCLGVELCFPCEVLTEADVVSLAHTVRQMLKSGRSLALLGELPADYQYGKTEWLAEAAARQRDRDRAEHP